VIKKKRLSGKCFLCPDNAPKHATLEAHHVVMQAAGGRELPTINICSNCHDNLHKQALNVLSSRKTEKIAYFAPKEMERARPYVMLLVHSIIATRENKLADTPVQITLNVPRGFRDALHLSKIDAGYKNLEKFVLDILAIYLHSKGVNVTKDLEIY